MGSASSYLAVFFLFFLPGTVTKVVLQGPSAREVLLPHFPAKRVVLPGAAANGVVLRILSTALPGRTTLSLLSITPPQTVKKNV